MIDDKPIEGEPSPRLSQPAAPVAKPSVLRELLRILTNLFWTWVGFDAMAADFQSHETAVRKAKSLAFVLVAALLSFIGGYWVRGGSDASEIQSLQSSIRSNEAIRASYSAAIELGRDENANLKSKIAALQDAKDQSAPAVKRRVQLLCKDILDFDHQCQNERAEAWSRSATMRFTNRDEAQNAWREDQRKETERFYERVREFQLRFFGRARSARDELAGFGLSSSNLNNSIDFFNLTDYRINLITRELQGLADKIP